MPMKSVASVDSHAGTSGTVSGQTILRADTREDDVAPRRGTGGRRDEGAGHRPHGTSAANPLLLPTRARRYHRCR